MGDKTKKITIGILAVSNMFAQCCNSLIGPFYPLEAAKKGTSETMIGLIFSCSEFVVFLTSPVFGSMMSQISPRFMYVAGLCVYGICDVMFGFLDKSPSGTPFIAICFATRIVEATGTSALMTASYAIAGSIYPDRISTVLSILQSASGIGYIIGPAVGGVLYQFGGYGFPFWILGTCVFLCGLVSLFLMPKQKVITNTSSNTMLPVLKSPLIGYGALCIAFNMVAVTSYFPTFAQELTKFDVGPAFAGIVMILPAMAYAVTAPIWGIVLDKTKVRPLPLTVIAFIGLIVDLLFFGPAPFLNFVPSELWIQVLCCALLGFFVGASSVGAIRNVTIGARSIDFKDEDTTYGLVAGITQSSSCFGSFLGPLLGGILTGNYGFAWSEATVGFICIIPLALGFLGLFVEKNRKDHAAHLLHSYNSSSQTDAQTPLLLSSGAQADSTGV